MFQTCLIVDLCLRTRISIQFCVLNTLGLWFRVHVRASVSSPLTKHVWIVVLVVYKHRLHPVLQTRLECGSLCAYTHQFPALCFKHVWIMVPCLGTSICLLLPWSNTFVSNAFGLWISVCAHGSVSSLVQTRLIMVACLFRLEPKWLRLTWIIPCKCLVLLVYPSFVQMVLSLESGDCGATCSCIASFNYFENYAPDGSCVIKLAFLVTLDVKDFRTGCCGTRWLCTARITVDRLVL